MAWHCAATLQRSATEHLTHCALLARDVCPLSIARIRLDFYASGRVCQKDLAGRKFAGNLPSDNGGFALVRGLASAFVSAQPVSTVCGSLETDT